MNRILIGCVISVSLLGGIMLLKPKQGCAAYTPVTNALVAHAGGGTPHAFYANNLEAMDLAVKHGFRFIELDFVVIDGQIVLGHDEQNLSATTVSAVAAWMKRHPHVSIVTDMKSGNEHLPLLKRALGTERVIPQIYHPDEFSAVKQLGYDKIIFTAYRWKDDSWRRKINDVDLWAVTIPKERWQQSKGIKHPVYLHTVNEPLAGDFGLYTDCLIPAR